ncbi:hypothetical protein P2318_20905 [Myxococcaceae bacterium GXIMD 01537]
MPRPTSGGATAVGSKTVLQSRGALASPESLGHARQGMNAEAHRLLRSRSETQTVAQEHREHRATELLSRELTRDFRSEPPARPSTAAPASPEPSRPMESVDALTGAREVRVGGASGGTPAPATPDPELKVRSALELIERIEVFVRSQRPALRMSLGGALDATVEVERTGPREVALRLQGRRGPVPEGELSRIRDALEARGLRLRALLSG